MHQVDINGRRLSVPDGTRLSDVFMEAGMAVEHPCGGRGLCQKCMVTVNGTAVLSCQYIVTSDITVSFAVQGEILSETGAAEGGTLTEHSCFVLDIGTTTLALALVSLDEKRVVQVVTRTNPQRAFGADVMSRIGYCRKNGPEALHTALRRTVNEMLAGFRLPPVPRLYVAGNATMLHLFFNVDCSAMGVAPYRPVFLESKQETAEALGLVGVEEVLSLPSVAAFVGADLVAGLNLVGLPPPGKYRLLVDLGTNAEILLFSKQTVLCTAAAAGPCFEGANISCGTSATAGAIYAFSLSPNGTRTVKTVGDAPATGLCGTGLVDVIAALVETGQIDETGLLEDGSFEITSGLCLTQEDVRQFQLAKSAVCAAILTLVELQGISFEDIDTLYISGGFSAKIDLENAVKTGLLPRPLREKCVAIRNSSLLGTVRYACEQNDLSVYLQNATYVDLSAHATFSEQFMENMFFERE